MLAVFVEASKLPHKLQTMPTKQHTRQIIASSVKQATGAPEKRDNVTALSNKVVI
jgi:hypothetical protein